MPSSDASQRTTIERVIPRIRAIRNRLRKNLTALIYKTVIGVAIRPTFPASFKYRSSRASRVASILAITLFK